MLQVESLTAEAEQLTAKISAEEDAQPGGCAPAAADGAAASAAADGAAASASVDGAAASAADGGAAPDSAALGLDAAGSAAAGAGHAAEGCWDASPGGAAQAADDALDAFMSDMASQLEADKVIVRSVTGVWVERFGEGCCIA